jgi:hypothetical protein
MNVSSGTAHGPTVSDTWINRIRCQTAEAAGINREKKLRRETKPVKLKEYFA